jgi:hypothetical protein
MVEEATFNLDTTFITSYHQSIPGIPKKEGVGTEQRRHDLEQTACTFKEH